MLLILIDLRISVQRKHYTLVDLSDVQLGHNQNLREVQSTQGYAGGEPIKLKLFLRVTEICQFLARSAWVSLF